MAMQHLSTLPTSRRAIRNGFIDWMSDERFTHMVTLTVDRNDPVSFHLLTKLFKTFSYEIDRYVLGVKEPRLRQSFDRFEMIAMPEKLDTNPHLHGAANFSTEFMKERLNGPWQADVTNIWRRVSRGSGDAHFIEGLDRGLLYYITKEVPRNGHEYLHSWDFHRDDKLVKRPSAIRLQRTPATRRPRTH
jgi:hypothetical protein